MFSLLVARHAVYCCFTRQLKELSLFWFRCKAYGHFNRCNLETIPVRQQPLTSLSSHSIRRQSRRQTMPILGTPQALVLAMVAERRFTRQEAYAQIHSQIGEGRVIVKIWFQSRQHLFHQPSAFTDITRPINGTSRIYGLRCYHSEHYGSHTSAGEAKPQERSRRIRPGRNQDGQCEDQHCSY